MNRGRMLRWLMQRVGLRDRAAIVLAGIVLSACAPEFRPALQPEAFKSDSGPRLIRVSLLGNAPDIILTHPMLAGDTLVGATSTPRLALAVGNQVLRADSTGRLAIPVYDITRIVAEPSDKAKGNAAVVGGILLFASLAALFALVHPIPPLRF